MKVDRPRDRPTKHLKKLKPMTGMGFKRKQIVKNADRTGLEPATSAVTGRHSNQLNYRSNIKQEL